MLGFLIPMPWHITTRRKVLFFIVFCTWVPMEVMGGTGKGSVSSSSSRPSTVKIGALLTSDSFIGRAAGPAIVAAVDDVNSDPSILPGTKLNFIIHDTNCSGFLGTVEGNYWNQLFNCVRATFF